MPFQQVLKSVPDHSDAAYYGQIATLFFLGAGFLYTLVRWPLYALLLWGHRKLGEEAWRTEIAAREADHVAVLDAREVRLGIIARLTVVERNMITHESVITELPEIKSMAVRACETADRTERTVNEMSKTLIQLGQELSEIKGFLQRGSDQFRQSHARD
jgi:hypothetical protein